MNSLIGLWLYTSLIYQGQPLARPNPELKIYYSFENESVNEIFYFRENETGTCRRKAEYEIVDAEIRQKVTIVDPANAEICAQDTDMQLGNYSATKFEVIDDKLYLHLPLGEETLIYVWEKINGLQGPQPY